MRAAPLRQVVAREPAPPSDTPLFWRNLKIVTMLHLLALVVMFVVGRMAPKPAPPQILWLDGGALPGGGAAEEESTDAASELATVSAPVESIPESEPEPEPPPPTAVEPPAPSEIVEPRPAPATPKPATPKPATPKPATPKPTTPKPKPKTTEVAALTTPKPKASPGPAAKKPATPGATKTTQAVPGTGTPGASGNGKGTSKTGTGGGGASEHGWYFDMLHDRFYSRWEQPVGLGQDVITTVKLRILKDGTIASREIVKSSGTPQMDESVLSAAQKVQQIDPLPAGLGNGEFFELNVNFKVGG